MTIELVAVGLLAFVAATVHSSVGFGAALVFVPAATLIIGPEPSVAAMLVSVPLIGTVLYGINTPRTPLADVVPVAGVSILSLPVGLLLLTRADEDLLRMFVGFAVLSSVLLSRFGGSGHDVERQPTLSLSVGTGLTSGLMRGATSIGGPPLVLYYQWLGGGAWRFRSRMCSSTALSGVASLGIATLAGVFHADMMPVVLASLPGTAIGIAVGFRIQPLIEINQLHRISTFLLIGTSLLAIATASSGLL
jgi:uncharacterized membrane protein YfcA